jgi:hypothetical protein
MQQKLIIGALIILSCMNLMAQDKWAYVKKLYFPIEDSVIVRPYLSTLADDGRFFVISSKILDSRAHNSIYYLMPGDTVFKKFIDFDNNGDSDSLTGNIGAIRGIDVVNNDIYIMATQPYPKTAPNTVSALYIYKNSDTANVEKFGFGLTGGGYGSFNHGLAITRDTIAFAGISFGTSFRAYNYSYGWTKYTRGNWILPDSTNGSNFSNREEPGGPQLGGRDLIRDVALIPGGDYDLNTTRFFTSRNSYSGTQLTGGIAVWEGGTQRQTFGYVPARITDFDGYLSLIDPYPYGITVDNENHLWVAGIDTTRRWVKAFQVDGVNAISVDELPAMYSGDLPDPNGAPMTSPCDVVISPNGKTAWVIDMWQRAGYMFSKEVVSVNDLAPVKDFALDQNFPNPFNPSTLIRFTLDGSANVRLVVTDVLGREIEILAEGRLSSGSHVYRFNGENLSSGVYLYTLTADGNRISKKMLLMK